MPIYHLVLHNQGHRQRAETPDRKLQIDEQTDQCIQHFDLVCVEKVEHLVCVGLSIALSTHIYISGHKDLFIQADFDGSVWRPCPQQNGLHHIYNPIVCLFFFTQVSSISST